MGSASFILPRPEYQLWETPEGCCDSKQHQCAWRLHAEELPNAKKPPPNFDFGIWAALCLRFFEVQHIVEVRTRPELCRRSICKKPKIPRISSSGMLRVDAPNSLWSHHRWLRDGVLQCLAVIDWFDTLVSVWEQLEAAQSKVGWFLCLSMSDATPSFKQCVMSSFLKGYLETPLW